MNTNTVPFLKGIDSFELEARFSTEHAIKYNDIRESTITFKELEPFLSKLPEREQDLVELYYKYRKNQKDIAKMFGVTQGAVSSRLSRAMKRLEFVRDLPKIDFEDMENILNNYFEPIEIEIIKNMIKTTCQSRTAKIINKKFNYNETKIRMTQVKIRHRFEKCIIQLKNLMKFDPGLKKYYDLLIFVKNNLYKLHEVKLPHFKRPDYIVYSLKD